MDDVIQSRLVVLVVLTVLGVGMAAVGTALGVAEPLSSSGDSPQLNVTEENLTFRTAGGSEAVVTDISNVGEITVEQTSAGNLAVRTVEQQPLTEREREKAREIAVSNDTVAQGIDTGNEYELTVGPVQQLNISSSKRVSYDADGPLNRSENEFTISTNTTGEQEVESVTITRDPNYAENRAVVWIRQRNASGQYVLKYTVDIDLANQSVIDITHWDTTQQNSRVPPPLGWREGAANAGSSR